jgi:hypothetical protein
MVGAGVGDNFIPDDSLIGRIVGARPLGSDIDKNLLGIPCKEAPQVSIEVESNDGVFLLLRAVVVRSALHTARQKIVSI